MKKITNKSFLLKTSMILGAAVLISAPFFASAATLTRQLDLKMTGNDVTQVQTFLASDVTLYPQGLITGYYGSLTAAAVSRFQTRNGLEAVGRVGPLTLNALNVQMSNGLNATGDTAAATIGNLSVTNTNTTATFNWNTNELARGKVYYSTFPIRQSNTFDQTGVNFVEASVSGSLAPYDGVARMSQMVNISGLTPNTTYYYLVESLDAANNTNVTLPASFYTAQ